MPCFWCFAFARCNCPPLAADGVGAGDHVGREELQAAIDRINHAAEQIEELKNTAGAVQQITTGFQDFMRVAGYAGTALALEPQQLSGLRRGYDPLNGYADLCRALENGAEEAGESLPLTGIIVVSVMFVGLFLAIFLMTRKKSC